MPASTFANREAKRRRTRRGIIFIDLSKKKKRIRKTFDVIQLELHENSVDVGRELKQFTLKHSLPLSSCPLADRVSAGQYSPNDTEPMNPSTLDWVQLW
jgi:hypothetical protein